MRCCPGQAFAFIGGPEHDAYAKIKGAELRTVVNCVDRGNIYFCAAKGEEPTDKDWPAYFKGKKIAIGPFGGTPNSIMRYLLKKWNLDAKKDVTLIETANSATVAVVKSKQAQIGEATEPYVTQGVRNNIWGEPFLNIPKELGPYAYSTFNVRLDTIQKEPELVRGFVRGMVSALKFLYANKDESAEIAKKQFPTMPLEDLKATLDRSFADELWSKDGQVSRAAWDTAKAVVMGAGILKNDVKYEEIIDMSFVDSIKALNALTNRQDNHTGKKITMSEPIWNQFLTERDKAVFGTSGYGARQGFGKRPALLIIDVNWAFCGDKREPILESIKRWRNSCGEDAWDALPYIKKLIDKCHDKGVPVIYTTGVRREDNWDTGSWGWKNSRNSEDKSVPVPNLDGNEIAAPIAPGPKDIVVLKQKPSGFFGTNMASYLTLLGCDSVIVTGTTTSGCVRATVLDAFSLNYRIALAEEGCFDRSQASHAINLCDMNAKYADVVKTSEVLEFINALPSGQYDLPAGNTVPETGRKHASI